MSDQEKKEQISDVSEDLPIEAVPTADATDQGAVAEEQPTEQSLDSADSDRAEPAAEVASDASDATDGDAAQNASGEPQADANGSEDDARDAEDSANDTPIWEQVWQMEQAFVHREERRRRRTKTVIGLLSIALGLSLTLLVGILIGYRFSPLRYTYQPPVIQVQDGSPSSVAVAAVVNPATVLIQCGDSYGSGFFIRENGYIATNYHVVEKAVDIVVKTYTGETRRATLCGYSAQDDLAVIKIDGIGYPTVRIGDSDALLVGQTAVAIGNPSGAGGSWSVTQGIVSAIKRPIAITASSLDSTIIGYVNMIQTDATVNPGNSGGPLCNAQGEVIGIVTCKNMKYDGMGFATPIRGAMVVLEALINNGSLDGVESPLISPRPFLGIKAASIKKGASYAYGTAPASGALVSSVNANGAAHGLLQANDIIVSVNGRTVTDSEKLLELLNTYRIGDSVTVKVIRNGEDVSVTVTLQTYRPDA